MITNIHTDLPTVTINSDGNSEDSSSHYTEEDNSSTENCTSESDSSYPTDYTSDERGDSDGGQDNRDQVVPIFDSTEIFQAGVKAFLPSLPKDWKKIKSWKKLSDDPPDETREKVRKYCEGKEKYCVGPVYEYVRLVSGANAPKESVRDIIEDKWYVEQIDVSKLEMDEKPDGEIWLVYGMGEIDPDDYAVCIQILIDEAGGEEKVRVVCPLKTKKVTFKDILEQIKLNLVHADSVLKHLDYRFPKTAKSFLKDINSCIMSFITMDDFERLDLALNLLSETNVESINNKLRKLGVAPMETNEGKKAKESEYELVMKVLEVLRVTDLTRILDPGAEEFWSMKTMASIHASYRANCLVDIAKKVLAESQKNYLLNTTIIL